MAYKTKQYLKFGKNRYTEADVVDYKSEAKDLANRYKKDGFLVRVVSRKEGYKIFTHGKPKY